uniref:Uncharacterized protein n=2 Tax=Yersinia enterocolitica TaxID=630 RepID=F4MW88_YEREN|nr:unknown protein [Yersinia enterocolitica W22703]
MITPSTSSLGTSPANPRGEMLNSIAAVLLGIALPTSNPLINISLV